jgi:hypothetical protein
MLDPQPDERRDVRYEKSDARVGVIFASGAGLVFVGIIVQFVAAALFDAFKETTSREDAPLPGLAAEKRAQLPRDLQEIPPPRLQENEAAELARSRRADEQQLNSYGWIDVQAGVVHIPIAEAMRLLADPKTAEAQGIRVDKGGPR